ncbi:MAG: hypothetical protein NVSMB51_12760 [Solirubrobacteraceae bacterium]
MKRKTPALLIGLLVLTAASADTATSSGKRTTLGAATSKITISGEKTPGTAGRRSTRARDHSKHGGARTPAAISTLTIPGSSKG